MQKPHAPLTHTRPLLVLLLLLAVLPVQAESLLKVDQVSDKVYAIVGPFGDRNADNLGNNATFGFIVTDDGVILIDAGGSYQGAAAIGAAIASVTDLPVRIVINTGGQDHRWLGNGYFKERGARLISSRRAVEDQRARSQDQLYVLGNLLGPQGLEGTTPSYAEELFDEHMALTFGGVTLELHHAGPAHTPGDLFAWLPDKAVMFSGDIVYIGRMLGVIPVSSSRDWIETFNTMASFSPKVLIPGHGPASTIGDARADTLDYLTALRAKVSAFMEAGGGIEDIGSIDQSEFSHLASYDELKGRNAQQVFQTMEWE